MQHLKAPRTLRDAFPDTAAQAIEAYEVARAALSTYCRGAVIGFFMTLTTGVI